MIKVLNITEEGRGGGALNRIVNIAKALKGEVDFHIICPKGSSRFTDSLVQHSIPYTQIGLHHLTKNLLGAILYVLCFIPEVINLCFLVKKHKPDILHANGSWQIKGVLTAKICGVRSVWHMNDMYQPKAIRLLFKIVSRFANHFIYASVRTKDYYTLLSKPIDAISSQIIPAPIDTIRFDIGEDRQKSLVPKSGINLITVGYINNNKGLETLIQAATILKRRSPDLLLNFLVIGPILETQESYKQKLDKLIEQNDLNNIHFMGFQANTEEWLAESDIYICSSRYESSPIALWEALACGKPVVSTDVGDVKEIIEKYNCGEVVSPNDPEAMANGIRVLLDRVRSSKGDQGSRLAAVENFSLKVVANQHLSFYKKILNEA